MHKVHKSTMVSKHKVEVVETVRGFYVKKDDKKVVAKTTLSEALAAHNAVVEKIVFGLRELVNDIAENGA